MPAAAAKQTRALQRDAMSDVRLITRELAEVADYIAHVKREIGALRANEIYRERIPVAHDELGSVVTATASATHAIMAAAEGILGSQEDSFEAYREQVETQVMAIFEACSFQDITGQRISKVVEALGQLEKRLSRFASAVNARDSDSGPVDPEDALRQARKEILLLNGPQMDGDGIAQDDIDALFG
jgi:chemotaxis protein CheZ